ncbi:hypothetical protein [Paenibacillus jilunlii]|uniref:Uncharacterized protein n=1 Tax=Paenibacillus jilunlii TaxID=682956 RepID=A0A1G9IIY7_9BACL|nr:hypothetical protein [Paenibacillus jilunlii]KWX72809.1 hypothetical protein AML91_20420 [Paenibacillus jilunlii]SDL24873.1 hypothetical protein SAMN05216191_10265 [Paenibacillus jilunlii]
MKNKMKLFLSFVLLFVIAYISFGAWVAHDTRIILEEATKGNADIKYMNSSAFKNINPVERGMTADSFKYNKSLHHIGFVFPLHFFFVSRAFVTQEYTNDDLAFREPVSLSLKLKSGKWFATKASIKP